MKIRALFVVLLFGACGTALAARSVGRTFLIDEKFPLSVDGTLILENTIGDIEVTGVDGEAAVLVEVLKTVVATDEEGIEEGRFLTELMVGGDANTRVLRTVMGGPRKKPWSSSAYWRVKVPKSAHLRISSQSSNHVRVMNMRGNVYVKNFNGTIIFDNDTGLVTADSANGSILLTAQTIQSETRLTTVNGHVTVRVRPDADVRWVAETVGGDIRTNLPVRGMFAGPSFRGSLNAPGGTLLVTASLTGNVHLLGNGLPKEEIKSVRSIERIIIPPDQINQAKVGLRRGVIEGSITYNTMAGEIAITEVRGGAILSTNAGTVQLGAVFGDANVESRGGSLQLGEILGSLKASTRAGDVFVEAARRGGTIETTGGTIRLLYTGGPTRLVSGGGDVVVRQAAGPVDATTRSGDISISVDRTLKKQKIDAVTEKGNIVLNVSAQFGADFDLTILTDDPAAHTIQSDFTGLSISREQADGKTRIHATGRINGGGERVTLQATGGSIRIATAPIGPALLGR
jgi:DUF4097 and DUF4098 domain-containing protein YvlB